MLPGAHIESAKDAFKAFEYCSKEETRVEGPVKWGIPPAARVKGNLKARNKMLLEKGAEQAVEDGDIAIKEYPKVKAALDLYRLVTIRHPDLEKLDNHWIHGEPGVGKSRMARMRWPNLIWSEVAGDKYLLRPDTYL